MKKKAPAGRVSEKKKTEKIIRKMKADLTASSKSDRKRKEANNPPSPKKASQKKMQLKVSTTRGTVRKKEEPEKRKKKSVQEVSPKKEKPPVTKAGIKKKDKAVSKKARSIAAGKTGAKLTGKDKAAKKEKPEKPSAKATKGKKPIPLASGKQKAVPKSVIKPGKKVRVAAETKTEMKKKTVKRKKPLMVKREKAALSEAIKKEKVMKIFRPEVMGKEGRKIKAGRTDRGQGLTDLGSLKEEEAKEGREEKKAYADEEGILPPVPVETLPLEYGENSITLITVNPQRVFAFWEVRDDTLNIFQGTLTIRQYDTTDIDYGDAKNYVDREVSERAGALYLDVDPAKDYVADIGILSREGLFVTIARSHKVSTPRTASARSDELEPSRVPAVEEAEFPQKETETEIRVGY